MEQAPLHTELAGEHAGGAEGGSAVWIRADDGVRLRVGLWREGGRGSVLMLPGRTEYIEKYVHAAALMRARGYATAIIDWRGQGLSDRPLADPLMGHVESFAEYQRDMAALRGAVERAGMPEPHFLVSHSMGGCIALRTLMEGAPWVRAAAFSGPMWGIQMTPIQKPLAGIVARTARSVGRGRTYAPTTGPVPYVVAAPFEGNTLTTDAAMFALMKDQLARRPELRLGGPSITWLDAALRETFVLSRLPSPDIPAYVAMGSRERVADPARIVERMARWPGARFDVIEGAEHEIVMETPERRTRFFRNAADLFDAQAGRGA